MARESRTGIGARIPRWLRIHHRGEAERERDAILTALPEMAFRISRHGVFLDFIQGEGTAPSLPPAEFLGRTVQEVMPADLSERIVDAVERALQTGEIQLLGYELPLPLDSGEMRSFVARIVALVRDEVLAIVGGVTERKWAEKALHQSEERFREVLGATGDVVFRRSLRTDAFDYMSPAVLQMTGFTADEFVAMGSEGADERIHPDDRRTFDEHTERLLSDAGGTHSMAPVEYRWKGKDGEYRWLSSHRVLVRDEGGRPAAIVGTVHDITERKRAEEALHESEERLRTLADAAFEGIAIHDGETILDANGAYAKMLGYEGAEVIGMRVMDMVAPQSRDQVEDILASRDERLYEPLGLRKDGTTFPAEVRGKAMRYRGQTARVVAIRDVTEGRRTQEALRDSEERLRALVANTPVILFAIDREGVFTAAEGRGMSPLGLRPEEHIGYSIFEVYRDMPDVTDVARRALGGEAFTAIVQARTLTFEAHVGPVRDGNGEVTGAIAVATNITERQRAEEALRIQRDLATALSSAAHVDEALRLTLDAAIRLSGMDSGAAYLIDGASGALDLAAHRGLSDAFVKSASHYEEDHANTRKIVAGKPTYTPFAELPAPKDEARRREALHTIAVIPIRHEGSVIGCLNVASHTVDDIPGAARHGLEAVAARLGSTVAQIRGTEALRESEERLRTLVANAPVMLFAVDREGVITTAEGREMRTVGVRPEDHVGRSVFDLYGDNPEVIAGVRRALAGAEFTSVVKRWSRTYHVHALPVRAADGTIAGGVAVATDTTERKRAEEALQESEERYRTLLESTSDSVYVLDRDWRHIVVNEAAERFVHRPKEELLGNSLLELFPGVEATTFFRTFARVMETREPAVVVDEYTFADGRKGWYEVHVDPVPEGILCISRDITERKRAEEALQATTRQLLRAQEVAKMGFLDWNLKTNEMFWSDQIYELYGVDRQANEATIGLTMDLVHPDDRAFVEENLDMAKKGEKPYDIEHRKIRPDGQVIWVHAQAELVRDADGNPESLLGIVVDITERKQAEEALQEAREQLERRVERQVGTGGAYGLSFRELTVLYLVADGQSDKEIAAALGIRPMTAQKHVSNILAKMKAGSRTEAAARALREGLLT